MPPPRVLVVDDEPNMCRSLAILLSDEGRREVVTAPSGDAALRLFDESTCVVVCDLSMPGMDGLELLRRVRARAAEVKVILMTAYSTVPSAVEAMRLGAYEYLIKPFTDDEITAAVEGALRSHRPAPRGRERFGRSEERLGDLVGRSE